MDKITIMSMNCRGLGDLKKRRDVMQYIKKKGYSIVFLQDTHLTPQSTVYFDSLWCGKAFHSCFSSRSRGTSILLHNKLQYNLIKVEKSECGNLVILNCKLNNESFLFVNIYGPNEDNPTFYKTLAEKLDQFDCQHVVVAGDLNFVISPEKDSLNYVTENNVRAKRAFLDMTDKYNLIDAWRTSHPNDKKYTWLRKNPTKAGRLDMFFVNEDLFNSLSCIDIIPGYRTDHNIITLTIHNKQRKGDGIWKFNVSHLRDDEYRERITACIVRTIKQYATPVYHEQIYDTTEHYSSLQLTISDSLFYETLVLMIRGDTVQYSKQKAKQTRNKEENLQAEIISAENRLTNSYKEDDISYLDNLKSELEELRKPKIDGLIVRSRVAWHEHGEKNSKYFLSLEKRNANRKSIEYIQDGATIITKMSDIIENFSSIYENKYTSNPDISPDVSFIAQHIANQIEEKDRAQLETNILFSELTEALKSMKKGKTPGSNGFPVEFFRCFWAHIGPFLHRALIEYLKTGKGLFTHREGIITLIPKKGKDLHTYKAWRPITLLNTDYKIVSTAISNRLKTVMTKIINPAQTAYTSNRYIGENTRLMLDVIHWTKKNQQPGIILAADFEAAFESVDWQYLELVLKELNFGPNFINIIKALYLNKENYSRILLNGYLGKKVYLGRGIRQGDPASGYLFNLAASIFTEQIRKSSNMRGILIGN